jgi:flavin reductase (DIM6/NTAB) family NADH-FMN oxidoreductase RutF
MKKIEWHQETEWLKSALSSGGAFVVAKDASGKANPMTIGWAQIGIVWSVPVMTVLIRESRYTHACITQSSTFSVCVPRQGELKDALQLCGTRSGRDVDKAVEANLTFVRAQTIDTPIIEACGLHYECEIIARTQQVRDDFTDKAEKVLETYYPKGDHHLIVFGRILAAYAT